MEPMSETPKCFACGRDSTEVPLIALRYREAPCWICPQDIPVLIHDPGQLAGKLPVLMAGGGYIYHSDHSIPPSMAFDDYARLVDMVRTIGTY